MPREVTREIDPTLRSSRREAIITNPPAQVTHRYDSNHRRSPFARIHHLAGQASVVVHPRHLRLKTVRPTDAFTLQHPAEIMP